MIQSFRDRATADLFAGHKTRANRDAQAVWGVARRKLAQLDSATSLLDLLAPPGNRLKSLVGDRVGQHGIRVNDQHRLCFTWKDDGPHDVELTDYH